MTPWAVSVLRTGAVTLHSGSLESWHRRGSLLVESWHLKGRFQKAERARIFLVADSKGRMAQVGQKILQ